MIAFCILKTQKLETLFSIFSICPWISKWFKKQNKTDQKVLIYHGFLVSLFIIRQWFFPPTGQEYDEIKLPPKVGAVDEIYDYVFPMIL